MDICFLFFFSCIFFGPCVIVYSVFFSVLLFGIGLMLAALFGFDVDVFFGGHPPTRPALLRGFFSSVPEVFL